MMTLRTVYFDYISTVSQQWGFRCIVRILYETFSVFVDYVLCSMSQGVFITYDGEKICTYLHRREAVEGKYKTLVR